MKTMTCKELGGTCNAKLRASSWDEMADVMTNHVMTKHPDVAKKMAEMFEADPKQWSREMKPKWDATPQSKSKAA
jgi:predicted small metal-binding protein